MVAKTEDLIYLSQEDLDAMIKMHGLTYYLEGLLHADGLLLIATDRKTREKYYSINKVNHMPVWHRERYWLASERSKIKISDGHPLLEPDFTLAELELAESIINGGET